MKNIPELSFNYIINEYGRTFKVTAYSNNNFHNIYPQKGQLKSIWLYLNSTIAYLIQQLIMRSNLGDGAGKLEADEHSGFPIINVDLEDFEMPIHEVKNLKEEFGTMEQGLASVSSERRKLDTAVLEAIGFSDKKERDRVLLDLYKATFQLIQARFANAQSLKNVKSHRNKVSIKVYIEQLKVLLIEFRIQGKKTIKFASETKKLIKTITSETRLQNKIFEAYWKERFGESYNQKKVIDAMQGTMFE